MVLESLEQLGRLLETSLGHPQAGQRGHRLAIKRWLGGAVRSASPPVTPAPPPPTRLGRTAAAVVDAAGRVQVQGAVAADEALGRPDPLAGAFDVERAAAGGDRTAPGEYDGLRACGLSAESTGHRLVEQGRGLADLPGLHRCRAELAERAEFQVGVVRYAAARRQRPARRCANSALRRRWPRPRGTARATPAAARARTGRPAEPAGRPSPGTRRSCPGWPDRSCPVRSRPAPPRTDRAPAEPGVGALLRLHRRIRIAQPPQRRAQPEQALRRLLPVQGPSKQARAVSQSPSTSAPAAFSIAGAGRTSSLYRSTLGCRPPR